MLRTIPEGIIPEPARVQDLMGLGRPIEIPDMPPLVVDLGGFDALLTERLEEAV